MDISDLLIIVIIGSVFTGIFFFIGIPKPFPLLGYLVGLVFWWIPQKDQKEE